MRFCPLMRTQVRRSVKNFVSSHLSFPICLARYFPFFFLPFVLSKNRLNYDRDYPFVRSRKNRVIAATFIALTNSQTRTQEFH